MKYRFIREKLALFPVEKMCRALEVSPGGYYRWCKNPESGREQANQALLFHIKVIHKKNRKV